MKLIVIVVSISMLSAGCVVPRYTSFSPSEDGNTDLHLRLTLTDGSVVELRHASITEEGITGTARGGRRVTVTSDRVRNIEQASGSEPSAAPVGAGIVIMFGLLTLPFLSACTDSSADSYVDYCPF